MTAEDALVKVYDGDPGNGGEEIGSAWVYHLPAPNHFDPQTLKVGVHWQPSETEHEVYVVVDPEGKLTEISDGNNTAKKRFTFEEARSE